MSLKGAFKRTMRAIERGDRDMVFTQMMSCAALVRCRTRPQITPETWLASAGSPGPVCHPTMLATRGSLTVSAVTALFPPEDYDLWMRVASGFGRIRRLAAQGFAVPDPSGAGDGQ